jgi:hypothetical protein
MRMSFRKVVTQFAVLLTGMFALNPAPAAAEDSSIGGFIALACAFRIDNRLPDYQKLYDNCVKIEAEKYLKNRDKANEATRERYGDGHQPAPQPDKTEDRARVLELLQSADKIWDEWSFKCPEGTLRPESSCRMAWMKVAGFYLRASHAGVVATSRSQEIEARTQLACARLRTVNLSCHEWRP